MKKETSKRISVYVDKKTYEEFRIYAIMINKSVSSLLEEYMKSVLKDIKKLG